MVTLALVALVLASLVVILVTLLVNQYASSDLPPGIIIAFGAITALMAALCGYIIWAIARIARAPFIGGGANEEGT